MSLAIEATLKKFIDALDNQSKEAYSAREDEHNQWADQRKLKTVELEQKIDILDTENIWCIGIVKKIVTDPKHGTVFKVHYQGWSDVYDEYMCLKSPRLANNGFITSRKGPINRNAQIRCLLRR
jgi:hypothetical protein